MGYKYMILIVVLMSVIFISFIIANSQKVGASTDPLISFFDIEETSISGEVIKMESYKGQKILIVNVAS